MADPLDALRLPVEPVDPDPEFAESLRARLQRALLRPGGDRSMTTSERAGVTGAVRPQGHLGYAALWVPDVDRAAAFYTRVLGWACGAGGPYHRTVEGAVPHQGIVSLAALPPGVWDGWTRRPTLFTCQAVDDVDAAVARVRAAGGQADPPVDEPHGRTANCLDDQGLPFAVYADPGPPPPAGYAQGALGYLTFEVADSARARSFLGAVFGWGFTAGHTDDGWAIEGATPMGGIHGGRERSRVVPMYVVDDIAAAVSRVREAGGTADSPAPTPWGALARCTDDQGTHFQLGRLDAQ